MALAKPLGVDSELIPKIGTAIGAGVSLNGLLCGSISSMMILIGAKYGRTSPGQSPKPVWDMADTYLAAFRKRFGAVNCRELTRLDVKTPEGLKEYFEKVPRLRMHAKAEICSKNSARTSAVVTK